MSSKDSIRSLQNFTEFRFSSTVNDCTCVWVGHKCALRFDWLTAMSEKLTEAENVVVGSIASFVQASVLQHLLVIIERDALRKIHSFANVSGEHKQWQCVGSSFEATILQPTLYWKNAAQQGLPFTVRPWSHV